MLACSAWFFVSLFFFLYFYCSLFDYLEGLPQCVSGSFVFTFFCFSLTSPSDFGVCLLFSCPCLLPCKVVFSSSVSFFFRKLLPFLALSFGLFYLILSLLFVCNHMHAFYSVLDSAFLFSAFLSKLCPLLSSSLPASLFLTWLPVSSEKVYVLLGYLFFFFHFYSPGFISFLPFLFHLFCANTLILCFSLLSFFTPIVVMLVLFRACFFVLMVINKVVSFSSSAFLISTLAFTAFYCFVSVLLKIFLYFFLVLLMFFYCVPFFHCRVPLLLIFSYSQLASVWLYFSFFFYLCSRSCSFVLCYVTTVIHLLLFHFFLLFLLSYRFM